MARTTLLFILLFVLINVDSKKLRGNDKNTLKRRILKPLYQINNEITANQEDRKLKDKQDKEPKDKAPKDKAPKDKAPKDKAPEDKAPKDKAPKAPPEGASKGPPKDAPKGPPKEPPKDVPKAPPKEGPKEPSKESPKEAPKEPPKDYPDQKQPKSVVKQPEEKSKKDPKAKSPKQPKSKMKKPEVPKAPKVSNPPQIYYPPQSIPILETLPPTSSPIAIPVAIPVALPVSLPVSPPITINPVSVPTPVPTPVPITSDGDSVSIPGLMLPYNKTISYSCPISSGSTRDTNADESNSTNVFEDVKITKASTVNASMSEIDTSNTTAMEANATNVTTIKKIEGSINYGYKLESITEISNETEYLLKKFMFNALGGHVCPSSRRLMVDIDDDLKLPNYQITEVDYQSHFHRRLEVLVLTTTARDTKYKDCIPEIDSNNTCTKYKGSLEVKIDNQGSYSSIEEVKEGLIDYLEYFASNTNFTIIDDNLIGMTITTDITSKDPQGANASTQQVDGSSGGLIGMIVGIVALVGILFGLLYMKKERKARAASAAEGEVIQADSNKKKGEKDIKVDGDELELAKNGSTVSAPPMENEDVPWAVATPVRECQTMR